MAYQSACDPYLRSRSVLGRYLAYGYAHPRRAAAKLRRDAGQSIEEVSRFLDHSSLAVTSLYLRRIEVVEDNGWSNVAQFIGI